MPGAIGNSDYGRKHNGTLYVVGSAPCALDDLAEARRLGRIHGWRGKVMAINEAAALVRADFIASLHPEHMARFRKLQQQMFPDSRFTTHAAAPDAYAEAVDFYWRDAHSGATSAFCGVKIGQMMGFTRIILCGCPMTGGDGYAVNTRPSKDAPRFGFCNPVSSVVRSHRHALDDEAKTSWAKGVYSMSGYSREVLGAPEEMQQKQAG